MLQVSLTGDAWTVSQSDTLSLITTAEHTAQCSTLDPNSSHTVLAFLNVSLLIAVDELYLRIINMYV